MTRDESIEISAEISAMINGGDLRIEYTVQDLKNARLSYSEAQLEGYRRAGLLCDSSEESEAFEKFYVIKKLCDMLDLWVRADDKYLKLLFAQAKRFTERQFYSDPYLMNVSVPNVRLGRFMLLNSTYDRGELFQHEMPDLDAELVVPHLGFFSELVAFPSIYEGVMPWVSVCPSEISSMQDQIRAAHGRTLVLGLGLGYYPFVISGMEEVESVTIIERQSEIIELFETHLLPQYPNRDKIRVIKADAFDYLRGLNGGEYDYCFADIWEGQADGAEAYLKIKEHEKRLVGTEFTYWIEEQIKSYLKFISEE